MPGARVEQRQDDEGEAGAERRHGVDARDGVAGRHQPAVGRQRQHKAGDTGCGKAQAEPAQGARLPAIEHPKQPEGEDGGDDAGQAFDADGDGDGGCDTGPGGAAWPLQRVDGAQRHDQQQQDLRRVMVETTGRKVGQRHQREGRERKAGQHTLRSREPERELRRQPEQAAEHDQRVGIGGGGFSAGPDERPEQQDEPGDRRIDQPRPVHRGAVGRVEPVLGEVVPALAVEEIAHFHEPHGIVGVVDKRHPAVDRAEDEADGGDQKEGCEQPPVDPIVLHAHHRPPSGRRLAHGA